MAKTGEIVRVLPLDQSPGDGGANRAKAGRVRHLPLAAMVARLVRKIRAEMTARRALGRLSHMSELDLGDIGLTRADVERVVRHGRY
ncbi:MAG: DUF1127 domain-containing protein [Geminicoccaceae bacterium]